MRSAQLLPLVLASSSVPAALGATLPDFFRLSSRSESAVTLQKPAVSPPFSEDAQDRDLRADLPTRQWRFKPWPTFWMPKYCREEAVINQLQPADFEVRDVWYEDCAAAWTICRHRGAKEPWGDILKTLSQVPVGMRQHVANLVILPGRTSDATAAYTRGSVLVFTPSFFKLGVLFHEFTHILDMVALQGVVTSHGYAEGTAFSETKLWTRAYGNDSAVPTAYARTSWQEDFADAGRWALSDMTHAGGLSVYSPGWRACAHQIAAYKAWLGELVFPRGGVCSGKVDTSPAVPVFAAAKPPPAAAAAAAAAAQKKPGSGLDGTKVKKIVMPKGAENMLWVYHGPAPGMQ
ncbi:hypothetical protein B0T24DRAFT_722395 [Lasiosphaeria ovina]|uniref:Conidiation-specific protein 13 n=1 Tax=Lasiosphaeria ovina TaxID=92902 RepID=A0AAE0K4J9_9PEZI|nr:hypothetical protein B0T24DRAFT_722395 [Lasiosphaeria ovina]